MYKIPKESIRNLLELISTFSKMTECKYAKFNTYFCFLAMNNWKLKLKFKHGKQTSQAGWDSVWQISAPAKN